MSRYFVFVAILLLLGIVAQASNYQGIPDGTYRVAWGSSVKSGTRLTFRKGLLTFHECNMYRCSVYYDRSLISISRCAGTKMHCSGSQEQQVVRALERVNRWGKRGPLYFLEDGKTRFRYRLQKL